MDEFERSESLLLRPNLAFASAAFEERFGQYYHETYYRYAQSSLALGILLIGADFLVDELAFSQEPANIYRLYLCIPILSIGVAYSFTCFAKRNWQIVMSSFIVVVGCSVFWVLLLLDRHGGMGLMTWVGVLNFIFLELYCFVILGVQFRYALVSGLLILLLFEAAMLVELGIGRRALFYWSYHVITLFLLASVIGWWREFLLRKDFAMQASLKAARNSLWMQNSDLEREVVKRTRKIQHTQDAAMMLLASVMETRDNETGNHVLRTQHYVKILARRLQSHPAFSGYLSENQIDILFKSAPLHDIGKVGIPDSILRKPGKLDAEEFEIMKSHTTLGFDAIERAEQRLGVKVEFLACAKEIALNHQEKWDGSGYPRGLAGLDIPISARLMAVADMYDALTTRRVYKEAIRHDVAVCIILDGSGKHFDPDVAAAFAEVADECRVIACRYADNEPALNAREATLIPPFGIPATAMARTD